jgi:hypothetical protein
MNLIWMRSCPICGTLLNKADLTISHICPKCFWMWGRTISIFTGRVMAHLGQIRMDNYNIADLKHYDNKRIGIKIIDILDG